VRLHLAAASLLLTAASCAGGRPPALPPILPLSPVWKTLVGDFVQPPLAADGRRLYVATRDGAVRALELDTGAVAWKVDDAPGVLAAAGGVLLVRAEGGTVRSLQPRTGGVRWTTETGVTGLLPPTVDGDRALVAGTGLACLDLATGHVLWTDRSGADITAPPVVAGERILTGESDGALRSRDRATGVPVWSAKTGGAALEAPPLVDLGRRRAYLGTMDRRIVQVNLENGDTGWRWRVGADVADHGLLLPNRVLFVSYDAVLYSLRPGGNLDWRAPLPSRPLSGPVVVDGYVVVACLENVIVAVAPETGRRAGSFRTPVEIRTPPLFVGSRLVIGLRDRSVVAFVTAGAAPEPAASPEAPPATPSSPPATTPPPGPPASVEPPPPGR
jgi:outer membrane protein assembly factor BamB